MNKTDCSSENKVLEKQIKNLKAELSFLKDEKQKALAELGVYKLALSQMAKDFLILYRANKSKGVCRLCSFNTPNYVGENGNPLCEPSLCDKNVEEKLLIEKFLEASGKQLGKEDK